MDKEQRELLFIKHAQAALSRSEQEQFNALLQNDAEFRAEFDLFQIGRMVSDRLYQDELIADFSEWENEKKAAGKTWRLNAKWLIALLLAVAGGVAYLSVESYHRVKNAVAPVELTNDTTQHSAASTPFQPDSNKLPPRTNNNPDAVIKRRQSPSSRLVLAIDMMQNRVDESYVRSAGTKAAESTDSVLIYIQATQYDDALKKVQEVKDPNNRQLFTGFILFYLQRYNEAYAAFEKWKIMSEEEEKADWYMALCCSQMQHSSPSDCQKLRSRLLQDSSLIFHHEAVRLFASPADDGK